MNQKNRKNFWERVSQYPSFNTRFFTSLLIVLIIFIFIGFLIFKFKIVENRTETIEVLNLFVQSLTLILGIFAAYYALRQLVETRLTSLDQAGSQALERRKYLKAFEKWKESFYIRPDPEIFANACEVLLMMGDYKAFDEYIDIPEKVGLIKKNIFGEQSDKVIFLYLKSMRHLLDKNQGVAEKYLNELVEIINKSGIPILSWNFFDIQGSEPYQNLTGECKQMAENLVRLLSKQLADEEKNNFLNKKFATQATQNT